MDFDVRGIVQLASTELDQTAPGYPRHIEGIAVGQKAQRLHFLHGTGWSATNGTIIAHYRVRYSDGQTGSIPVVYGDDVRNWQFWPAGIAMEQAGPEPVWKGPQERWRNNWPDWGVRLYKTTWENPRPDIEIKAIDLISTMTGSAPFVIGITVE